MHASETTTLPHVHGRVTNGRGLDIRYDPRVNALVFIEDDWGVDVRSGGDARMGFREQLDTPKVRRLPRRFAA